MIPTNDNNNNTLSLDLEFRPRQFSEVCGNQEVISLLENFIETDTLPRILLFHGQPGVAKSTLSFIVTSALLCHNRQGAQSCGVCPSCQDINGTLYVTGFAVRGMDVFTFNLTSHDSTDDYVKHIASVIATRPLPGKKKIVIIEELHKATIDQQECLNNVLEFPPAGVYVIICTSMIRKIAKAVQKRSLPLSLNSPDSESLIKYLRKICMFKGQVVPDGVLKKIMKTASNNGRQCVKLLETVFSSGDLAVDAVINRSTLQLELYLKYFEAIRLGILPIMEFVEDTLKEAAVFFSGLDDFIYTCLKTRYSASFVMEVSTRKSIKETMQYFPDPILISIIKSVKGAGYITDDDAKKALFVIGFDANPKIVETLDYSDAQNYALTAKPDEDANDQLIDKGIQQFEFSMQKALGGVSIEDL